MNAKQREVLQEMLKRTVEGRAQVLVSITCMKGKTYALKHMEQRRLDGIARLEEIVAYQGRAIDVLTEILGAK